LHKIAPKTTDMDQDGCLKN